MPIAARTEGRDRIPSDMVSAIMTEGYEHLSCFTATEAGMDTHASLPRTQSQVNITQKRRNEGDSPPSHRPVLDL